jgi:hypothetical protein
MRGRAPLTHCITNIVAANFTANVRLAVGAAPAMVVATEEVAEFAVIAAAMLINLGNGHKRSSEGDAGCGGCSSRVRNALGFWTRRRWSPVVSNAGRHGTARAASCDRPRQCFGDPRTVWIRARR